MNTIPVEYILAFQEKLGDVVSQALDIDNQIIGGIMAAALYELELQISAAVAGNALGIPHELAIAYFISGEAIRYERSINKLSLMLSSKKRKAYETHRMLIDFVAPIAREVTDKSISERFFALMIEDIKRTQQR